MLKLPEGYKPINISTEYVVVAEALMSQGKATSPRTLFLAFAIKGSEEVYKAVIGEWNHETGGYGRSDYFYRDEIPELAYRRFTERLIEDCVEYTSKGVPLTGRPQG